MKNWGVIVTAFYIVVIASLTPAFFALNIEYDSTSTTKIAEFYSEAGGWLWIAIMAASPLILFFVKVDTTQKDLKPRRPLYVSVAAAAFTICLLTFAAIWSFLMALGMENWEMPELPEWSVMVMFLGIWLAWGIVFYRHAPKIFDRPGRIYQWFIRASVLELLVAVPSNVIVQQRDECSAPIVTSFGVATGLAIMLMSFGPGILFLYKERMRRTGPAP